MQRERLFETIEICYSEMLLECRTALFGEVKVLMFCVNHDCDESSSFFYNACKLFFYCKIMLNKYWIKNWNPARVFFFWLDDFHTQHLQIWAADTHVTQVRDAQYRIYVILMSGFYLSFLICTSKCIFISSKTFPNVCKFAQILAYRLHLLFTLKMYSPTMVVHFSRVT